MSILDFLVSFAKEYGDDALQFIAAGEAGQAGSEAAGLSAQAAREAIAAQQQAQQQLRADLSPFQQFGAQALGPLAAEIGFGFTPGPLQTIPGFGTFGGAQVNPQLGGPSQVSADIDPSPGTADQIKGVLDTLAPTNPYLAAISGLVNLTYDEGTPFVLGINAPENPNIPVYLAAAGLPQDTPLTNPQIAELRRILEAEGKIERIPDYTVDGVRFGGNVRIPGGLSAKDIAEQSSTNGRLQNVANAPVIQDYLQSDAYQDFLGPAARGTTATDFPTTAPLSIPSDAGPGTLPAQTGQAPSVLNQLTGVQSTGQQTGLQRRPNPLLDQAAQLAQRTPGNEMLQRAQQLTMQGSEQFLSPEILENPLLKALQSDVQKRLFANQAARGKLGTGGTAEALQEALVPQAIQFGLQRAALQQQDISNLGRFGFGQEDLTQRQIANLQSLGLGQEDIRQRGIENLFRAAGIGQSSAAQTGVTGANIASNIGQLGLAAGEAERVGRLSEGFGTTAQLGGLANLPIFNPQQQQAQQNPVLNRVQYQPTALGIFE